MFCPVGKGEDRGPGAPSTDRVDTAPVDTRRDGMSIVLQLTGPAEERDVGVARELLDEWLDRCASDDGQLHGDSGVLGDVGSPRLVLWLDRSCDPGDAAAAMRTANEIGARAERKLPLIQFEIRGAVSATGEDRTTPLGASAPADDELGLGAIRTVEATELASPPKPCRVSASPTGLTITRAGEQYTIGETKLLDEARLAIGVFFKPALVLKLGGKRRSLQLAKAAAAPLLGGLGRELATRWCVRSRVKWFIPIALLFLFTSLPMPADPEAGLEALPLDVAGLMLGGGLLVIALIARIRPMAWLILADSFWLALLAGRGVQEVLFADSHWAWLFLDAWLVVMALQGVKTYRLLAALPSAKP